MNISYLRTYVTLAKNGNISQTAVLLGYSKSTIYDQLKSLESELAVSYTHLTLPTNREV